MVRRKKGTSTVPLHATKGLPCKHRVGCANSIKLNWAELKWKTGRCGPCFNSKLLLFQGWERWYLSGRVPQKQREMKKPKTLHDSCVTEGKKVWKTWETSQWVVGACMENWYAGVRHKQGIRVDPSRGSDVSESVPFWNKQDYWKHQTGMNPRPERSEGTQVTRKKTQTGKKREREETFYNDMQDENSQQSSTTQSETWKNNTIPLLEWGTIRR